MVGWHHQLNGHEFEQALGVGDGREAWRAAVHGSQRVGHDWATELNLKGRKMVWSTEKVLKSRELLGCKAFVEDTGYGEFWKEGEF